MKTYFDLLDDLKKEARELHPNDYKEWSYKVHGVEIYFSCR